MAGHIESGGRRASRLVVLTMRSLLRSCVDGTERELVSRPTAVVSSLTGVDGIDRQPGSVSHRVALPACVDGTQRKLARARVVCAVPPSLTLRLPSSPNVDGTHRQRANTSNLRGLPPFNVSPHTFAASPFSLTGRIESGRAGDPHALNVRNSKLVGARVASTGRVERW